jgi:NADH-quinone oxidoreductase subunit K
MIDLSVGLNHYLIVSVLLFIIGISGVILGRKNVIMVMMALELMLLATNIAFVAFSSFLNDLVGQVFSLFILTVAAAEAAIGFAIVVVYYRNRQTVDLADISSMRG